MSADFKNTDSSFKIFKFRLLSIFFPLIKLLKDLTIIPRTWFPASYIGERDVRSNVTQSKYPDNHVSNTKYTWATFFVHNVLEQFFMSHMNRYFVFVALVQLLWREVSPVNPITTVLPLVMVFGITTSLAIFDDIRRLIADTKQNNRMISKINSNGEEVKVASKKICVGDVVKVYENEEIPCDLVVLSSSNFDGTTYIQTANLDGEIDLKIRPLPKGLTKISDLSGIKKSIRLQCSQPNAEIYSFNSSMTVNDGEKISLSAEQLLLQSCIVKNTLWTIGMCVYNGNETKCGMNKRKVPSKRAQADYFMDKIALFVFIFQILLFLLLGILGNSYMDYDIKKNVFYLNYNFYGKSNLAIFIEKYIKLPVSFWLLSTYMIPISLKMTMDLMKMFYSLLIMYDKDMYDEENDIKPNARNSSIVEDLGQVEYVLSDKTGTLTQNVMEFQRCSISDGSYTFSKDEKKLQNFIVSNNEDIVMFFRTLALCHSCIKAEDGTFRSVSPDEEALVQASIKIGVKLIDTEEETYTLNINDKEEKWKILKILKFNSDRKRMSVVLKNIQSNEIILFSKGADDVMLKRIASGDKNLEKTAKYLVDFAQLGLRTLICGYKKLDEKTFDDFVEKCNVADNVVGDGRQEAVDKCYDDFETDLKLIGSTAIEDKLQEEVPETISFLRQAGISVWMLTGDKFETAKQIGFSCNLVTKDCTLIAIEGNSSNEVEDSIDRAYDKISTVGKYSIILEGETLRKFGWNELQEKITTLLLNAKTVICARVTPGQKAEIVKFVKNQNKVTLSIGDGGNDVPMIQAAHVGVGITGKEGLQASRASDFCFGKFKFLKNLIFIHGHYSLYRSGIIIQFSFYKNIVLAFLQVLYNLFTHLSGESPYNDVSLSQFNSLFTLFVPVFILDRVISKEYLISRPKLYFFSKGRSTYNAMSFSLWFLTAILNAILVLFAVSICYLGNVTNNSKSNADVLYLGIIFFTSINYIVDFMFLLFSNTYNVVNISFISVMLVIYHIFMIVYNFILPLSSEYSWLHNIFFEDDSIIYYQVWEQIQDPNAWLVIIFVVSVSILIMLIFKYLKLQLSPNIIDTFKLMLKKVEKAEGNNNQVLLHQKLLFDIGGGIK